MQYISWYASMLGKILLAADDIGLTGVWFEGQKYFPLHLDKESQEKEIPLFQKAKQWLDIYFSGKIRGFLYRFTLREPISRKKYGKSSAPSHTDKPPPMDRLQNSLLKKGFKPYVCTGSRRSCWAQ